jgi:hypothetical protein
MRDPGTGNREPGTEAQAGSRRPICRRIRTLRRIVVLWHMPTLRRILTLRQIQTVRRILTLRQIQTVPRILTVRRIPDPGSRIPARMHP